METQLLLLGGPKVPPASDSQEPAVLVYGADQLCVSSPGQHLGLQGDQLPDRIMDHPTAMHSSGIRLNLKEMPTPSGGSCPLWPIAPGGTGPWARMGNTRVSHGQWGELHCLTFTKERKRLKSPLERSSKAFYVLCQCFPNFCKSRMTWGTF